MYVIVTYFCIFARAPVLGFGGGDQEQAGLHRGDTIRLKTRRHTLQGDDELAGRHELLW